MIFFSSSIQLLFEVKRHAFYYFEHLLKPALHHAVFIPDVYSHFTEFSGFKVSRKRFYQWLREFIKADVTFEKNGSVFKKIAKGYILINVRWSLSSPIDARDGTRILAKEYERIETGRRLGTAFSNVYHYYYSH